MVLKLCFAGDVLPNSFVLANCNRYFLRAMLAPEPGVSHAVGCSLGSDTSCSFSELH